MKQTQYRSMKMMMTLLCTALIALNSSLFISCQDKDIEREGLKLKAPDVSQITGQLSGDNYVLSWPALAGDQRMQVVIYRNGTLSSSEIVSGTSYTQRDVPTNVPFG